MTEPGTPDASLEGKGARERKALIRELLAAGRLDAVALLAEDTHKVIGFLISLTYDSDPLIAWRAVEAAGMAAERVGARDPRSVRNYLRRLFWLITEESGGICWYAPQAMAEIARTDHRFDDFVPITMNLINEMADEDLDHFRPGILWAIGRLGPLAAEHMGDVMAELDRAMSHEDAHVRGLAAWAMGHAGQGARVALRPQLMEDHGAVRLYLDGGFRDTTVATLARQAAGGSSPGDSPGSTGGRHPISHGDALTDEPPGGVGPDPHDDGEEADHTTWGSGSWQDDLSDGDEPWKDDERDEGRPWEGGGR